MSKKHNGRPKKPEIEKESEYYRLKTKAVDDLVTADASNSPPVSAEELRSYRSGPKFKIAGWLKAVFIKFWFACAVCYFFIWGLSGYLTALFDLLFITGAAMGIVTDLMVNPSLRFFEQVEGEHSRWMMVTRKSYSGFLLNILYAYVVLFFVYTLYNAINYAVISATGASDTVPLGVEPILFGLFYLGFDLLFLQMKHTMVRIIQDARDKISQ